MGGLILNCDLGEAEPMALTEQLLALVGAASISCGVHAGDAAKTRATLIRAQAKERLIGAHPGLPVAGGRGAVDISAAAFTELLKRQVGDFLETAAELDVTVDYVKLHGSLYHAVELEPALGAAYLDYLESIDLGLAVFALSGGRFAQRAEAAGCRVYQEAFADRAYQADAQLLPRSESGAVLSPDAAWERFEHWRSTGRMRTIEGQTITLAAQTLCVHGDSPGALRMIAQLQAAIN